MLDLDKMDFQYAGVEYEYETTYNCSDEGCNEEGICRCGTLENVTVTEVDLSQVAQRLFENLDYHYLTSEEPIIKYCLERLLSRTQLREPGYWNAPVTPGYYGEEIEGCYMSSESVRELKPLLKQFLALSTNQQRIEFVLKLEYGYVLPELKKVSQWCVEHHYTNSIIAHNKEHMQRLNIQTQEYYKKHKPLINGILLKKDTSQNIYRLIDGYHRFSVLNEAGCFIVGYK